MKKIISLVVIFICLNAYSKNSGNQKIEVDIDEKKLIAGELQVFEYDFDIPGEGKGRRLIGVLLIEAPVAKVWELLADWDSMNEYVPGLEYYKTKLILNKSEKGKVLESVIEAELDVTFFLSLNYTLRVRFDEENLRQEWTFVTDEEIEEYNKAEKLEINESSIGIKNIEGFEYIEPYDGGNKTVYYYAPIVEVSIPVPDFVDTALSNKSLTEYMIAVKKKAEGK